MNNRRLAIFLSIVMPYVLHASEQRELIPSKPCIRIKDLNTEIIFRGDKMTLYKWIHEDGNQGYFGETMILNRIHEEPFFKETGTVKNVSSSDLSKIINENSLYCYDIKKIDFYRYYYGAIVCCDEPINKDRTAEDDYLQRTLNLVQRYYVLKSQAKNGKKQI